MDFKDAEPYLKMGIKHFCIGWDVEVLYRYCAEQGMAFREFFKRA
jgi:4-hydroxy-2-oxoheptanedioate aldolase